VINQNIKIVARIFCLVSAIAFGAVASASALESGGAKNSAVAGAASEPVMVAQNNAGQEGAVKITGVNAVAKGESRSIVSIESTGPLQYTAFKLLNPLRLILDFPNMDKGDITDQLEINKGVVESIRSLYFHEAEVLRVEIVLAKPSEYDIQKPLKNKLVIYLQESGATELAQAPKAEPGEAGPQEMAEAGQDTVRMGEPKVDPCAKMLDGDKERISLDFQGASIRNLLRIISDISGFNLILSNEVSTSSEKVHMRLLDVPWNKAFDVILKNSDLGVKCSGDNIIRIASKKALAKEEEDDVKANERKRKEEETARLAQPLITEVVQINYADIEDLAKNLNALLQSQYITSGAGGLGAKRRGLITVDKRTNKLILTDIQSNIDDMLGLIRILDIQTPQVMIEARIVEVNKEFTQELGVQWGLTTNPASNTNPRVGGVLGQGDPFIVDLSPGGVPLGPFNGAGLALGFTEVLPGMNLDIQLQALEKEGNARILSSPKVTTLDNKEAKIKAGEKIPFETVSEQGTQIEFVEAELSLTVTPHITSDDYIYMIIAATKNNALETTTTSGQIRIQTKEAFTEVLVANGDTTVLGGIYESEVIRNKQSVPFFSKLPLLGPLFRNQDDVDTVDELLIFITPTIVVKYEQPGS